tara:strand:+ start:877 stop:1626 length:750 start_codon:yes stop_codon:yes gene_type:complete
MRNYVMTTIAVLLLSGLSFGLILSFNLIEQDRQYLIDRLNELDAKYNTIQKELTEATNRQEKVLMLMAVYRDGINTLKEQMDEYNVGLVESINEVVGKQELLAEEIDSIFIPPPANLDEPMDEPFTEEDFIVLEEEQFDDGILVEEEEEVEGLEVLTPLEPAPVFACPERDRSVNLDRYIRRLEFSKTTSVVLNYDVVEGEIQNMVFTESKGNTGRRLYEALEKYLLDSAIIIEPEGRECRLPFRIVVE